MDFKDILKQERLAHQLTQEELGQLVGLKKAAIYKYENGLLSNPKRSLIEKLAKIFNVSPAYLLGIDSPRTKGIRIPILGRVVAGVPLEAIEDIEGYEEITPAMARKGEYFALRVRGKSMEPFIIEGDIVIVRKQAEVETGEIAIVLVNGDEATVKEIKIHEDGLMLIGKNVAVYSPHFYNRKQIEELPVQIIGKVVEVRRSL